MMMIAPRKQNVSTAPSARSFIKGECYFKNKQEGKKRSNDNNKITVQEYAYLIQRMMRKAEMLKPMMLRYPACIWMSRCSGVILLSRVSAKKNKLHSGNLASHCITMYYDLRNSLYEPYLKTKDSSVKIVS
jgi:hypothetical protein